MKLQLPNVTLLGIDCVNVERLQAALDASQRDIEFGAVKLLTSLPTDDPRLVAIPHIGDIKEYSRFCIEELTKYVDTEYLIMIQYDGFIISADKWDPDFLNYDYIGAPHKSTTWKILHGSGPLPDYIVGNGGFTLRSKKLLDLGAQFVAEGKMVNLDPEDAALCWWYRPLFEAEGMKWAPVDLARQFSVQEIEPGYVQGFGFHGFWSKNVEALQAKHPGYPTHFFLPRIGWARLERIAYRDFMHVAVDMHGKALPADVGIGFDVWLRFVDMDTMQKVWGEREEYFAKIGEVIEFTDEGTVSKVLIQTTPGVLTYRFHFALVGTELPEGAKELFKQQ